MSKKNLILGGILIVLIIFAYIQQGPLQRWKENSRKPDNFMAVLDPDMIDKIEIEQNDKETVVIEKEDKGWKVVGTKDFYVNNSVINEVKQTIKKMSEAELEVVSKNENKKKEFETDDSGIKLKISQSGSDHRLMIGKTTPDLSSSYISRPEDEKTYYLDVNARSVFSRDDWRDDQLFSFMPERIKSIRFQYPDREFMAEKIDNQWQGTKPEDFEVDIEKLDEILKTMGSLKAVEIPEQTFEGTSLEKHNIIIEAKDTLTNYIIMVGDANEDGQYYAKRGSSDNIYLITEKDHDMLDKNLEDIEK
ncbi:DUF4340 domain-containing protein [Candidatus Falkowbacteria bacterium]|nr:DUF4340 domain-containing protein [Candidatus Falkowbacteria bacterium]